MTPKTAAAKRPTPARQVAIRMPGDLLDMIDAELRRLRAESPGVGITFADAVRTTLYESLRGAENRVVRS